MHKRITFRGMDHSAVMENYINQQLSKIERFLENEREPIYINMVLTSGKPHAHHAFELRLTAPQYEIVSTFFEGPNMYDVVDKVMDTVYKKLQEQKKHNIDTYRTEDTY